MVEPREFLDRFKGMRACHGAMITYNRDQPIDVIPGSDEIVRPDRAEQILLDTMYRPDLDIAPQTTTETQIADGDPVRVHTVEPEHIQPLTKGMARMALGSYYHEEVTVLDVPKILSNELLEDKACMFTYADVIYSLGASRGSNGATLIIAKGLHSEPATNAQKSEYSAVRRALSDLSPRLYRIALLGTYDIDPARSERSSAAPNVVAA